MKQYIPNTLSALRIIDAVALFLMPVFTIPFFIVYAGFVIFDYLDGFLARKLNAGSYVGDRLDHIASILFVVLMLVRFCSVMEVPVWAVVTFMCAALIKSASLIFGAVRFKKAPFINSDWNKAAKCSVYLAPGWYLFAGMAFACVLVSVPLAIACTEELIINLTSKEYNPDVKTIIPLKKVFEKLKKK